METGLEKHDLSEQPRRACRHCPYAAVFRAVPGLGTPGQNLPPRNGSADGPLGAEWPGLPHPGDIRHLDSLRRPARAPHTAAAVRSALRLPVGLQPRPVPAPRVRPFTRVAHLPAAASSLQAWLRRHPGDPRFPEPSFQEPPSGALPRSLLRGPLATPASPRSGGSQGRGPWTEVPHGWRWPWLQSRPSGIPGPG